MSPTSPLQVLWAILPLVGVVLGLVCGVWLGRRQRQPPDDETIARYMGRVVNQEEIESNQRMLNYKMARNGRVSTRTDSGPNARVSKLRIKPTIRKRW